MLLDHVVDCVFDCVLWVSVVGVVFEYVSGSLLMVDWGMECVLSTHAIKYLFANVFLSSAVHCLLECALWSLVEWMMMVLEKYCV